MKGIATVARFWTFGLLISFGWMLSAGSSARTAVADERPLGLSTVSGVARFMKHRTFAPGICWIETCAKPRVYWSLLVEGDGGRFELDKIFDEGHESEPASIEVGGVTIKAGMHLSITGRVETLSRDYSVITDLQNIRVDETASKPSETQEGAPFFGWTCASTHEHRPMYVDVEQVSRGATYAMRVMAMPNPSSTDLQTLAAFERVALNMSDATIDFEGNTPQLKAVLTIDQGGSRLNRLNSVLRLNGAIRAQVNMVCDRTR
jgi:hypothetical protein